LDAMKDAIAHRSRRGTVWPPLVAFLVSASGCCVSHSVSIKNDSGAAVTIAAKDTGEGVSIAAGEAGAVAMWSGPIVAVSGSNVWFYPKIAYEDHPEARRRVFRCGICQAGFGYFVTEATLEPNGRLQVGNGTYEPERQIQW